MKVEDRLRDALRGTAETVDGSVPRPLPAARRRRVPRMRPLLTAAAMLAVLAASVTVARLGPGGGSDAAAPMQPFFIAARVDGTLESRDSATGALRGREHLQPRRSLLGVAAVGDGRTYYLLSQSERESRCSTTWVSRFSVTGAGRFAGFTDVSRVRGGDGADVERSALAVSPDGQRLAHALSYVSDGCTGKGARTVLTEVDLQSGRPRELWGQPGPAVSRELSWSADGRSLALARVVWDPAGAPPGVPPDADRAPNLRAGDRGEVLVFRFAGERSVSAPTALRESARLPQVWSAVITRDGRRLLALVKDGADGPLAVVAVSAIDGRPLDRVRALPRGIGSPLLKLDASGAHLLLDAHGLVRVAVRDGTARRLPTAAVPGSTDGLPATMAPSDAAW